MVIYSWLLPSFNQIISPTSNKTSPSVINEVEVNYLVSGHDNLIDNGKYHIEEAFLNIVDL